MKPVKNEETPPTPSSSPVRDEITPINERNRRLPRGEVGRIVADGKPESAARSSNYGGQWPGEGRTDGQQTAAGVGRPGQRSLQSVLVRVAVAALQTSPPRRRARNHTQTRHGPKGAAGGAGPPTAPRALNPRQASPSSQNRSWFRCGLGAASPIKSRPTARCPLLLFALYFRAICRSSLSVRSSGGAARARVVDCVFRLQLLFLVYVSARCKGAGKWSEPARYY